MLVFKNLLNVKHHKHLFVGGNYCLLVIYEGLTWLTFTGPLDDCLLGHSL